MNFHVNGCKRWHCHEKHVLDSYVHFVRVSREGLFLLRHQPGCSSLPIKLSADFNGGERNWRDWPLWSLHWIHLLKIYSLRLNMYCINVLILPNLLYSLGCTNVALVPLLIKSVKTFWSQSRTAGSWPLLRNYKHRSYSFKTPFIPQSFQMKHILCHISTNISFSKPACVPCIDYWQTYFYTQ